MDKASSYLKTHEIGAAAAKCLDPDYLASSDRTGLKAFTYFYFSGGTAGDMGQITSQ